MREATKLYSERQRTPSVMCFVETCVGADKISYQIG